MEIKTNTASSAESPRKRPNRKYAHKEGYMVQTYGYYSHAEGYKTVAIGDASHAEGSAVTNGKYSHAEGEKSRAVGEGSHAEGRYTAAIGDYSHTEGCYTFAYGRYSHAQGINIFAHNDCEHAEGYNNISYRGTYECDRTLHTIGNGDDKADCSNAVQIMQNGDTYIVGIGGFDGKNYKDAKSLQDIHKDFIHMKDMLQALNERVIALEDIAAKNDK